MLGAKQHRKTDGGKRFEIRLSRRGMCFVRSGREIETFDAYPRTKHDKESGLGDWPHISGYAYHFGVEIRFDPDLDEVFNVGNDKQTIRPIDDFWRIMADPEVALDAAVRVEEQYQARTRKEERKARLDPQITDEQATAPAIAAVTQASTATGKSGPLPENRREESKKLQEQAVQDLVEKTGDSVDKARKAIEDEARSKKYAVEFFESRGGVFFEPSLGNGLQRVAKINKLHPFYEVFYSRVAAMDDPVARHAIIVLLLTLAESELSAEDDSVRGFYETQRESVWSPFLKLGLKKLEELGTGGRRAGRSRRSRMTKMVIARQGASKALCRAYLFCSKKMGRALALAGLGLQCKVEGRAGCGHVPLNLPGTAKPS